MRYVEKYGQGKKSRRETQKRRNKGKQTFGDQTQIAFRLFYTVRPELFMAAISRNCSIKTEGMVESLTKEAMIMKD